MAAPQRVKSTPVTDRAHRYRANALIPVDGQSCLFCGSTRFLVPDHWDGHPDHTVPENLEVLCKACNTAKGAAFKKAKRGRLTKQFNPAWGGGATSVGQWMKAVGAITPHINRGDRGLVSDMNTQAAVDMIRATPQSKRREFAAKLIAAKLRRRNPANASADVFKEFHGYPADEVVTVSKRVHYHKHLAAAGELVGLDVWGIDETGHHLKGFSGALLAFNEKKNQLFIEGGDQVINVDNFGIDEPHEMETLGVVTKITYFANKTHLGDEGGEAVYGHRFRTTNENGKHVVVTMTRYPDLIYDVVNEQLLFSGGSYEILREGINK
jgi:hypothetical protein